jgi:putative ABC transport system ATP-binding protein
MKIHTEHLSKRVSLQTGESLTILEDISLSIDSGEMLGILGVSGSGKSTLLGLLAGLDLPTEGQVFWNQVSLQRLDEDRRAALRLHNMGFIFQNFELINSYTALENVLLPLELAGKKDAYDLAAKHLHEVGLKDRLAHYPNQLSGGEQQRVAIARAFSIQPKILFADEPTGNLDQKTSQNIIALLMDLNKKYKATIVCVTHDPDLSKVCTRAYHLSGGRLLS